MKIVRACLVVLFLGPAACFATDSGPDDNPIVEGIQCNGNVSTSCELIRTQAGIPVGKPLDEIQVGNARLRLETLPNFRSVRIHLIKGSHKHWVIVVIDVTEADPITMAFAQGTLAQFDPHSSSQVETLAARVTDHDLFGTGKVLDLAVVGAWPYVGGVGEEYAARLEYLDPRLFDSHKFFFTAGAFYTQSSFNFWSQPNALTASTTYQNGGAGVDFSVGMHLDTYSYMTVGYRYLQNTTSNDQYLTSDGVIQTLSTSPGNVLLFTAGRNSEDDPSFPTHGWLLHAYDGWNPRYQINFAGVVLRGTWGAGDNGYLTFQARPFDDFRSLFDEDLGVSLVYSHDFSGSTQPGAIRRARWYVGPGVSNLGLLDGVHYFEGGLKAGVRLETKHFGTVNLYLLATHPVRAGY
jgi:outer membrane protein assembly factor BamA